MVSWAPKVGIMKLTYYGMEHRGHLYLPGWAPHTPQSLGSGIFLVGNAGSVFTLAGGSAAGAAELGSGETGLSIVGCGAEISLSVLLLLPLPPS